MASTAGDDDRSAHVEWDAAARAERALPARVLSGLYASGATLALLSLALPQARAANTPGLLAIIAAAYAIAAMLLLTANETTKLRLSLALAWGSTSIAGVAYLSAQRPSPLVFFLLWVFMYASYFFGWRETVAHIAYVGALFCVLLVLLTPPGGVAAWWLVGMGTMAVAAGVIRVMRGRGESLVENAFAAARTDPLTRLSNRRGFRELLDREIARAAGRDGEVSVVLADVDGFAAACEGRGAEAGEELLRRLARVLDKEKRPVDGLARLDGNEFALVLPDADAHEGFLLAERLRTAVRREFARERTPVTISFGVASAPQHGHGPSALLRASEAALRAAKRNGRDRSMIDSDALRTVPLRDGDSQDVTGERFLAVVLDLAVAVDLRFSGSARHSEAVGRYAAAIARELGLAPEHVERVRIAGVLHDVGKVAVPDEILNKPAALTEEEYAVIKRHPALGEQMLAHPALADVREWVGAHHECPDGSGYPKGLVGRQIPLEARILAVADAYEAMTVDRCYRDSIGPTAAREQLERCAGTQFDAEVVEALLAALHREPELAGERTVVAAHARGEG